MKETRSTFRDWLRPTIGISGIGLISLLAWVAAAVGHTDPSRCLLFGLAPLFVVSLRYPWFGRILGWSGLLAQTALLFLRA